MLSCIYESYSFNNDQEGYTVDQIREISAQRQFLCPFCNKPVHYCSEGLKISHFKHFTVGDCLEGQLRKDDYISEKHSITTNAFKNWLANKYPELKIHKDYYLKNEGLIADLYFEIGTKKVAFELQFKLIGAPEFLKRRDIYKEAGINDIWIFIDKDKSKIGSPYEREYYKRNSRELYYFDMNSEIITYYKGLKSGNFLESGEDRLKRYISRTCNLNELSVTPEGHLALPEWRELYSKQLREIRKKLHHRLRAKKEAKIIREKEKAVYPSFYPGFYPKRENTDAAYRQTKHVEKIEEIQEEIPGPVEILPELERSEDIEQGVYKGISFYPRNNKNFVYLTIENVYPCKEYEIKKDNSTNGVKDFICKLENKDVWYNVQLFFENKHYIITRLNIIV